MCGSDIWSIDMKKLFIFLLVLIIGVAFVVLPFADINVRSLLGSTLGAIVVIFGIVLILTGIVGIVTRKKGFRAFIESLIEVVTEFFINA